MGCTRYTFFSSVATLRLLTDSSLIFYMELLMNDIDICIDVGDKEWIHASYHEGESEPFIRERISHKNKRLVAKALLDLFKDYLKEDKLND